MRRLLFWLAALLLLQCATLIATIAHGQEVTLVWDQLDKDKVTKYGLYLDGTLHEEFEAPEVLTHKLDLAPGSYVFELVACSFWTCSEKSDPWTSPAADPLSRPVIVNVTTLGSIVVNIGNVTNTPSQ
jgi:hypothetical protein